MKKKLTLAAAALFLATVCNAQGITTRISGQLTDLGDSLLYNLIDQSLDNPRTKGQLAVKDGKFDFTLDVQHPAYLALMDLATAKSDKASTMDVASITIIPGENVTINGKLDDFKTGGAAIYQKMEDVQKAVDIDWNKATQQNYDSLKNLFATRAMAYIKAHPNEEAAMILMEGLEEDNIKKALDIFTPEVRDGRMSCMWKNMLKMYEAQAKREAAAKKLVDGAEAPDFSLPDINGKQLKLSSLRGKYVVLDFWGSWCGWCIKGMPEMKNYYNKYAGKFEILGVDCNDTEAKWKAAVQKHQLPWKHVRQSQDSQNVSDEYGVQGFPTKIVIDPQGKIAKVVVGEDPEFYTYLDSLFGKK